MKTIEQMSLEELREYSRGIHYAVREKLIDLYKSHKGGLRHIPEIVELYKSHLAMFQKEGRSLDINSRVSLSQFIDYRKSCLCIPMPKEVNSGMMPQFSKIEMKIDLKPYF